MSDCSATQLVLLVPGAMPDDIARGLQAAQAVFDAADVSPSEAALAAWSLELWSVSGHEFDQALSERKRRAADVWVAAQQAALAACCSDRPPSLRSSGLELVQPL